MCIRDSPEAYCGDYFNAASLLRDGKVSGVEVTGVHVTVAQMLALRKKFLEETGQA